MTDLQEAAVRLHEALGRLQITATTRADYASDRVDSEQVILELRPGAALALAEMLEAVTVRVKEVVTAAQGVQQQMRRRGVHIEPAALASIIHWVLLGTWPPDTWNEGGTGRGDTP
ncbi:MAG: hypothetical protein M3537_06440 [Chloroflexota bacterium]|nr:hypothetical protein [Chloroflexota bacterium]